jgi:hypothetical protein
MNYDASDIGETNAYVEIHHRTMLRNPAIFIGTKVYSPERIQRFPSSLNHGWIKGIFPRLRRYHHSEDRVRR